MYSSLQVIDPQEREVKVVDNCGDLLSSGVEKIDLFPLGQSFYFPALETTWAKKILAEYFRQRRKPNAHSKE
jgi:hypothetical protein